jgi:Fe-S-cluster-containing dehydrogenase component
MKKWNLIIDIEKCEDCNNCFLACKDEHVDNDWPGYAVSQPLHGQRWMNIMRRERGQYPIIDVAYLPVPCMHCDKAPCIDPIKAGGQKDIVKSCPYEVIWWNEEHQTPQKCTFCAHLMDDGWKAPRCVQACPTEALQVVQVEDTEMANIIESENLEVWQPQYNTTPRVFYKNLYRYSRCFIGGSVAANADGVSDCATGARVTLIKDAKKIDATVTDGFGDFKFDNLEENGGNYQLEIVYENYDRKTVEVELKTSINVGDIYL